MFGFSHSWPPEGQSVSGLSYATLVLGLLALCLVTLPPDLLKAGGVRPGCKWVELCFIGFGFMFGYSPSWLPEGRGASGLSYALLVLALCLVTPPPDLLKAEV
ncbi:hypothetical protein Acr_03g0000350 [Actinidia rufa]|uniref:Uncharacterized protein n=1 Tax=Actinidia rufa TaxID=165716 RepID=A0A7J0E9T3_9ERIC|nr:hypothetical protein Acr_03g0000350 [Actinidia rufa]